MSELPMVLSLDQVNLTDDQFYRLCEANPTTPLERSASGALVIMSPVGGENGVATAVTLGIGSKLLADDVAELEEAIQAA